MPLGVETARGRLGVRSSGCLLCLGCLSLPRQGLSPCAGFGSRVMAAVHLQQCICTGGSAGRPGRLLCLLTCPFPLLPCPKKLQFRVTTQLPTALLPSSQCIRPQNSHAEARLLLWGGNCRTLLLSVPPPSHSSPSCGAEATNHLQNQMPGAELFFP